MFEKKYTFEWKIPVLILTGILVLSSGIYIGVKTRKVEDKPAFYINVSTGSVDNIKPELLLSSIYEKLGLEYNEFAIAIHRKDVSGYGVHRSKFEYEDLAQAARKHDISLQEITDFLNKNW